MVYIIILLLISFVIFSFLFIRYGNDDAVDDIPAMYIFILVFIFILIILIAFINKNKNTNQNTNTNTTTTTNQNIVIYKDIDKKVSIYCDYYPDTEICIELNKMSFKNLDNILSQEQKEKISNSVKDIENKIQNIKID